MPGQTERWKDRRMEGWTDLILLHPSGYCWQSKKKLNESVEYKKFKMETLATIIQLIMPNMYMAKLDIKDAYYSIPIYETHQKFLKFKHISRLFKFTVVLPHGYMEGLGKFTKLLKPPLSLLRKLERVLVTSYFDDLIIMDCSYSACSNNIMKIIKLFSSLWVNSSSIKVCVVSIPRN